MVDAMVDEDEKRLLSVKGIGKKRCTAIREKLDASAQPLSAVFSMSVEDLQKTFGLPLHAARAIQGAAPAAEITQVAPQPSPAMTEPESHVRVIATHHTDYPQRLRQMLGIHAPAQLHAWGNLALLERGAIGFCGSRNASDKGLAVTADIARQAAQQGWVIVSGHARGVDVVAHRTALEQGTGTIIVLAEGIEGFRLRRELKSIAKRDQLLIISEFAPKARWHVGRAMQRNATIVALSHAVVLVESRMEGGTFNAGQTALRLNCPLFVVDYQVSTEANKGNQYFIQRGAAALHKNQKTGNANISPLIEALRRQMSQPGIAQKQLSLMNSEIDPGS